MLPTMWSFRRNQQIHTLLPLPLHQNWTTLHKCWSLV